MQYNKRTLLAAGTEHYQGDIPALHSVPQDLTAICTMFERLGYECHSLLDPTAQHLRDFIAGCVAQASPYDHIAFYYSGHGVVADQHYLLTIDSDSKKLEATALPTASLPRLLWPADSDGVIASTAPQRVMLMIDVCFAAHGSLNVGDVAGRLHGMRPNRSPYGEDIGFWILACARGKEEAEQHAFVTALVEVVDDERNGGLLQPYLDLNVIIGGLQDQFKRNNLKQRAQYDTVAGLTPFTFIPNPRYRDGLPPGLDLASRKQIDLIAHWSPRGRGVEVDAQAGNYFLGRKIVMQQLCAWLHSDTPNDGRPRVVTGRPGSGKSAVLARLILDSMSDTSPPNGTQPHIDVAVHARGKNLREVADQISMVLRLPTADPAITLCNVAKLTVAPTLVVDALDEALEPGLVTDFLTQLAIAAPNLKLLIGARVTMLRRLSAVTCEIIDLDDDRYFELEDLISYARSRLIDDPTSPYHSELRNQVEPLARTIAERAGLSFLIAQIASRRIIAGGRCLSNADDLEALIPSSLDLAFTRDFERYGVDQERVRDLLTPLAYAEGRGLPWVNLWAPLAAALAARDYGDSDIRWLHEHAGAYVVEDRDEQGLSVYRLYHHELARFLRDPEREEENAVRWYSTAVASVPRRPDGNADWHQAHPYLLRHLAIHAVRAGRLHELVMQPAFLVKAEPWRLLGQLHRIDDVNARAAANSFKRTFHDLVNTDLDERYSYLEAAARWCGADALCAELQKFSNESPWRMRWVKPSSRQQPRILFKMQKYVRALAACEFAGTPLIVGTDSETVIAVPLEGPPLWSIKLTCTVLAVHTTNETSLVVLGCEDGSLQLRDLTDGSLVKSVEGAHGPMTDDDSRAVRAVHVAPLGDHYIAVSAGNDGTIRRWELPTLVAVGEPITAFDGPVESVALGLSSSWRKAFNLKSEHPIVVAIRRSTIGIWDLCDGSEIGRYDALDKGQSGTIVLTERLGKPWLFRVVLRSGVHAVQLPTMDHHVLAYSKPQTVSEGIAVGTLSGEVILAAGIDFDVMIWRVDDGRPLGRLIGQDSIVECVAFAQLRGRAYLVAGGHDAYVRVWDVADNLTAERPRYSRLNLIRNITLVKLRGRPIVVSAGLGPQLRIWDLDDGSYIASFDPIEHGLKLEPEDFSVSATTGAEGELVLVLNGNDNCTHCLTLLLNEGSGELITIEHAGKPVTALERLELNGNGGYVAAHYVIEDRSSVLQFWQTAPNLRTVGSAMPIPEGPIVQIAVDAQGRFAALRNRSGKIRILDLLTRQMVVDAIDAGTEVEAVSIMTTSCGIWLAAGTYFGDVLLWNLTPNSTPAMHKLHIGPSPVRSVVLGRFDADGFVAAGGDDRCLTIILLNGKRLHRIQLHSQLGSIVYDTDGIFIVGTSQGLARIDVRYI